MSTKKLFLDEVNKPTMHSLKKVQKRLIKKLATEIVLGMHKHLPKNFRIVLLK
jgi:hypothetical protein